jgi:Regulator of chromosome condensation (RCC1) repeat
MSRNTSYVFAGGTNIPMGILQRMHNKRMRAHHLCCGLWLALSAGCGSVNLTADASQIDGVATFDAAKTANQIIVGAGAFASCAGFQGGGVKCWGRGNDGALGSGSTTDSRDPVSARIQGRVAGYLEVADGGVCVKTTLGVECWSINASGVLDSGGKQPQLLPVTMADTQDVTSIAFATGALCVVYGSGPQNRNGQVYCAGVASSLGDGSGADRYTLAPVAQISRARKVTGGQEHFCALLQSGAVTCWGGNAFFQLGTRAVTTATLPIELPSVRYVDIAGGDFHTCGLTSDGLVDCWGKGERLQLGASSDGSNSATPVRIAGIAGATSLATAADANCVVVASNEVKCWGSNTDGLLNLSSGTMQEASPISILGLTNINAVVSRNGTHACGLDAKDDVYCWGSNYNGESGPRASSPQKIDGLFK